VLVRATRTISALTLRALFYGALFLVVVTVHVALTGAMRAQGWGGGVSQFASGGVVLGLVLALVNAVDWLRERRAAAREIERMRQGLPGGACCVVWRSAGSEADDDAMPWALAGPLRARYPRLARRLGVEGVAVVDFEVNAEGRAKNVHCAYAWPSDVFFEAAREALLHARFQPKTDAHVRFGACYRMPFVFRIAGAAQLEESGRRARKLRPVVHAALRAAERLRRRA
jgi:TonB family protein